MCQCNDQDIQEQAIMLDIYPYETVSGEEKITMINQRIQVLEQIHFQNSLMHQEVTKGATAQTEFGQENAELEIRLVMLRNLRDTINAQGDRAATL